MSLHILNNRSVFDKFIAYRELTMVRQNKRFVKTLIYPFDLLNKFITTITEQLVNNLYNYFEIS